MACELNHQLFRRSTKLVDEPGTVKNLSITMCVQRTHEPSVTDNTRGARSEEGLAES